MSRTTVRSAALVLSVALIAQGCAVAKRIMDPHGVEQEEYEQQKRAEIAANPDGECSTAEQCRYRCEKLERALDCYKTGKAALRGADVHYEGGWRAEKVAGSTDDVRVRHESDSEESVSLMPLARESFERACNANHAESCRILGNLVRERQASKAEALYAKACSLHDQEACEHTSSKK